MRMKALAASAIAAASALGGTGTAVAATTANGSASPAPASASCDARWPAYVQGAPDGFDAGDDGAYLWHDPAGGWGLRVSHPVLPGKANRVVFAGTITTRGTITGVKKVRDEKGDVVKVGPNGHTLSFRFVNYGGVDGADFTLGCTPGIRVRVTADKSSMPTRFVHLGDKDTHPRSNPFVIRAQGA